MELPEIAEAHARRGEPDLMFHWLERAWANRDTGLSSFLGDPFLASYKDDPRYTAFARKLGVIPGFKLRPPGQHRRLRLRQRLRIVERVVQAAAFLARQRRAHDQLGDQ